MIQLIQASYNSTGLAEPLEPFGKTFNLLNSINTSILVRLYFQCKGIGNK